jgi:EpsI family protein
MRLKQTLVASAVLLASALFMQYATHSENVPPSRPLSEFPLKIDSWVGRPERFDDQVYQVLGVDETVLAAYHAPAGAWVQLYVGFYESQREGELIHSPKNCMPGAGWSIVHTSLEPLSVPSHDKPIEVIKLILQKGTQRQMVLYWFQSRGRFIASEYLQKIYLVLDSITRHRTDGSFVRLITPMHPDGEETTLGTLKTFATKVIPILEAYLPS